MKTAISFWVIPFLLVFGSWRLKAQESKPFEHTFTPQIVARGEYLHGFQTLATDNAKPGAFISQRTRLTYKLSNNHFDLVIAPQDVRVWGASSHLSPDTSGSLSLAEGYGVIKLNANNKFKIGRQIIQYDEHRILGSLDWGMQSRRHDLLLFQHEKDTSLTFHLGAAWNQDKASPNTTVYHLKNHYKTLQFLWLFRKWHHTDLSFLFLNNGFQFSKTTTSGGVDNSTVFSQTLGLNSHSQIGKLRILSWLYYQTGKDGTSKSAIGDPKKIRALDVALDINYNPGGVVRVSVGGEYLSGTTQDSTRQDRVYSFNPFYGTNHRFNGYMDFFYAGNHLNSVGLMDAHLKINFQQKDLGFHLNLHHFASAENVRDVEKSGPGNFVAMSSILGQEIDITMTYKIAPGLGFQAGYSQFFGTETLQALKGGDKNAISNWAYIMVLFRPGDVVLKTGLFQ